jgi:hypothetical protein
MPARAPAGAAPPVEAGAALSMVPMGSPSTPTPPGNAGACATPEQGALIISSGEIEVVPGETQTLQVLFTTRPGAYDPLPDTCRVRWSLSANSHATVDDAGRMVIAAGAPLGSTFGLVATLADGRTAHSMVRVVRRGEGSLVGTFREVGRSACRGGRELVPPEPVRELVFHGDGRFAVTWTPFETRQDYWGTFVHDAARNTLTLRVESNNYLPRDLDPQGTVEFEGDRRIRLRGMWLGSAPRRVERPACVQVFERQGR